MALKLTDKEIVALAKKIDDKNKKLAVDAHTAKAKAKLPDAQRILKVIDSLPPVILDFLYDNRYSKSKVDALAIAKKLVPKDPEESFRDNRDAIEADVTLAAHDCTTMAQLCKKLGI